MTDFDTIQKIQSIIEEIVLKMDVVAKVSPEESLNSGLVFNISSPDSRLLIGKQGANLQAIQILASAIFSKTSDTKIFFTIDVDGYKKKREWHLKEDLRAAVEKVKMTGRPVDLEPMPAFERRMAHAWITENYSEIDTESIGTDPYRKIVLRLKKLN